MDELVDDSVEKGVDIYDILFEDVTEENFATKIEDNKRDFQAEYYDFSTEQLEDFASMYLDEFPVVIKNALDIAWDVANTTAAQFLDWQAFSISLMEGELMTVHLVDKIQSGLAEHILSGNTFNDYLAEVRQASGISKINTFHIQTVWQNNLTTAYSASSLYQLKTGDWAGWEFNAIDDAATTDICLDRDGKRYPTSNVSDMPPLHHRCRSEASVFDAQEMEDEGYKLTGAPEGAEAPAAGFGTLATTSYNNWIEQSVKTLPNSAEVEKILKTKLDTIEG